MRGMAMRKQHPLERVMANLETNYGATPEGIEETNRLLAGYLGLPPCDFTSSPDTVRRLVPPGWTYEFCATADGGVSCLMWRGDDMARGCGPSRAWALLSAAVWALLIEEERGWRAVPGEGRSDALPALAG